MLLLLELDPDARERHRGARRWASGPLPSPPRKPQLCRPVSCSMSVSLQQLEQRSVSPVSSRVVSPSTVGAAGA